MEAVADRILRDLTQEGVREAQQMLLQRASAMKLLQQIVGRHAVSGSRALDHGVVELGLGLHDDVQADHSFVAHHADLHREVFAQRPDDGNHHLDRKEDEAAVGVGSQQQLSHAVEVRFRSAMDSVALVHRKLRQQQTAGRADLLRNVRHVSP